MKNVPFGGLWFLVVCVVGVFVTVAAYRAGDRVWMLLLLFAVINGVMAYRQIKAGDL
jgi:hypothetical protein